MGRNLTVYILQALRPCPINEKDLLLRIADGEEEAFRQIFHQYLELVKKPLFAITKSVAVTDDLIQETFLRVWLHRDKLPHVEHFRSWVLHIAYNLGFTYLRDKKSRQKGLERHLQIHDSSTGQYEPEELTQFVMLIALVKQSIDRLPKQQKKVYILSREKGLKAREIADELRLSESTVKNTLTRALQNLRNALAKAGYSLLLAGFFFFH